MTQQHRPGNGAIFGIVSKEGLVKADSPVYLLDKRRWDGEGKSRILAARFTREDGGFEFGGLNPLYADYAVMATDEDEVDPKSPLIQDRVQPIYSHVGTASFGEWYGRAMRYGAICGIVGWPVVDDGVGASVPLGIHTRPILLNTAGPNVTIDENSPAFFPELGRIEHDPAGRLRTTGRMKYYFDVDLSLETIVDLDTIALQSCPSHIYMVNNQGTDNTGTVVQERANFTRRLGSSSLGASSLTPAVIFGLTFHPNKMVDVIVTPNSNRANWQGNIQVAGSFDLSAYSGNTHVVGVINPGVDVRLYANGNHIGTVVTALVPSFTRGVGSSGVTHHDPLSFNQDHGAPIMAFLGGDPASCASLGDLDGNSNRRDYAFQLAVFYHRRLVAGQVAALYKSLYDTTDVIPVLTGYAQEVVRDIPIMYWRLDDFVETDHEWCDSTLTHYHITTNETPVYDRMTVDLGSASAIDATVASPVAGRTGLRIPPGAGVRLRNLWSGQYGWRFRDRGTFSCWAKFEVETPPEPETIVQWWRSAEGFAGLDIETHEFGYPIGSLRTNFTLRRNTDGDLELVLWENGTVSAYIFDQYSVPLNEWLNIYVVVDKTLQSNPLESEVRLYVGTEAASPSLQQARIIDSTALYTYDSVSNFCLRVNPTPVYLFENFAGSAAEVAFYPDVLPLERIEAHWNAKDTV